MREETGVQADVVGYVGRAEWSYCYDSIYWDERVHFFLMRSATDSLLEHDKEHAEVRWMSTDSAEAGLKYESERRILREGIRELQGLVMR